MDVLGAKYRRVGRDFDGGYVMLDDFSSQKFDAAYSFGINDDVSWDEAMAALGMDIFMYDHTIEKLPKQGKKSPWRIYQNYVRDIFGLRFGSLDDEYLELAS